MSERHCQGCLVSDLPNGACPGLPDDKCDVCIGKGDPGTGKPCICGGAGTLFGAYQGLKMEMVNAMRQLDGWREVADRAYQAARKFIAKVEDGRARSVETYADMKEIVDAYERAKERG